MFKNLKSLVAAVVAVSVVGLPVVCFAGLPLVVAPVVGVVMLGIVSQC